MNVQIGDREMNVQIDDRLIANARIEMELKEIINTNGFRFRNGNVDSSRLYDYMLEHHAADLSWHRKEKHSGYRALILYKGVGLVCEFDCGRFKHLGLDQKFPQVFEWPCYQCNEVKRAFLKQVFENPYDKRTRYTCYKPTAEKFWDESEKQILGF